MKLSAFKTIVRSLEALRFKLPNGHLVPSHYHVTEVGQSNKRFIDCGGTVREETAVVFQLWYADDEDHRLAPQKMVDIVTLAEERLGIDDHEIEVEYQDATIGKYGLAFDGEAFVLTTKLTACLALDQCGIPGDDTFIDLGASTASATGCTPGGGCC